VASASALLKEFENWRSSFYFSKDTFGTDPISTTFISDVEAVTATGVFYCIRAVNEKNGVVDVVFLTEFSKKTL
jgi:hypothetical protein